MTKDKYTKVFTDEDREAIRDYPNVADIWPELKVMGFHYVEDGDDYGQVLARQGYTVRLDWRPLFDPPRWAFTVTKTETDAAPLVETFNIDTDETGKCIAKLLDYIRDLIDE